MRIAGLVSLSLLLGSLQGQVEIERFQFGIDDRPVLGHFNHVLVRVRSTAEKELRTTVRLQSSFQFSDASDGSYLQPIVLQPGQVRTLRFTPYVSNRQPWTVRVAGAKREHQSIPWGVMSQPGRGWIADPGQTTGLRGARIAAKDMPHTVLAMSGMAELGLRRDPDLDARQEQALLDWIELGGVLHLAEGLGQGNQLSDGLAVLSGPVGRAARGRGWLHRWPPEAAPDLSPVVTKTQNTRADPIVGLQRSSVQRFLPKLDLPLLYAALIGYSLLAVFGHIYWIRRIRGAPGLLASLVVIVIGGCGGVYLVGRDAHGNADQVLGLMRARQLAGGRLEIREAWTIFSVHGVSLEIRRGDAPLVLAAGPSSQGSHRVLVGNQHRLGLAVPIFTAQDFHSRRIWKGRQPAVELAADGRTLRLRGCGAVAEVQGLDQDGRRWVPRGPGGFELGSGSTLWRQPTEHTGVAPWVEAKARQLLNDLRDPGRSRRSSGQALIRVLARIPQDLAPPGLQQRRPAGWVLYEFFDPRSS